MLLIGLIDDVKEQAKKGHPAVADSPAVPACAEPKRERRPRVALLSKRMDAYRLV
jgi:hypothetical protein